jgi:transcriptional regulator with XRE-family HTH domain
MLKSLHNRHNHDFLELLRTSRKARSLRQRDVARLLGRGQATVSKVEAGVRRLDVIELRAWLRALDVDFVDFINRLEERLQAHAATDAGLSAVRPGTGKPDRGRSAMPVRTRHP